MRATWGSLEVTACHLARGIAQAYLVYFLVINHRVEGVRINEYSKELPVKTQGTGFIFCVPMHHSITTKKSSFG